MSLWKWPYQILRLTAWGVLATLFLAIFTPVGFVLRLVGLNPLRLRRGSDATSYWLVKAPAQDVASYLRPY
jgi:hypothetical protein